MATVNSSYINHDLFHIVFFACLLSVGLQGALLPMAAKKLKMVEPGGSVLRTFNDYQEDEELQLIKTKITKNHSWAGKTIGELKLRPGYIGSYAQTGRSNHTSQRRERA